MTYQSTSTSQGQDILSAYGAAVALAGRDEQVRLGLCGSERALLPSFDAHYRTLTALPRRMRRAMQRQWKRTLAGVALLMALGAGPAVAATINVDTTAPGVNLLDLRCSLIEALLNANDQLLGVGSGDATCEPGSPALLGQSGADTIVLPANSTITLTAAHNTTVHGPTGTPVITSRVTINGNNSTIRRDPADPDVFRIFAVGAGANLTLQRTRVSGGRTSQFDQGGGGITNFSYLTLTNSTISGNATSGYRAAGGGVYSQGILTITNSTISGNTTSHNESPGGGVGNFGLLTLTNSTISGNATSGTLSAGGGVYNKLGNLIVTNSTISGNSTLGYHAYGGGVSTYRGLLTLTNSTISFNSTSGRKTVGGGLHNGRAASATVTNSTVSGNRTYGSGADGGGVANVGNLNVTNSTISGNGTFGQDADGGGVVNILSPLTLTNCTITGNFTGDPSTSYAGGVFNDQGSLALTRTIISGNTSFANFFASEVFSSPPITPNAFNLFGHNGLTTAQLLVGVTPGPTDITATSNGTIPRTVSQILDPVLRANGGPTMTHSISPVSIAVDAVTTGCPPPTTDQRGRTRPRDGNGDGVARCDIGAVER